MSVDLEALVRHSLDTVDRSKRVAMIATVVALVLLVLLLAAAALHAPVQDPREAHLLLASITAVMLFVGLCTALLAMHMSRMAKAILRSIELTSRRDRE
jgi:uncharacterized membrane protein